MTETQTPVGCATNGKPINLAQLQGELNVAGADVSGGLGLTAGYVHTYSSDGAAADFPQDEQPTVDQVIADHVAMRAKTDAEYAAEFQDPNTTVERKQEIRDITSGLLPREQVPMTAEDVP